MIYGKGYDIFFKDNTELSNEDKVNKLKRYAVGDILTILRNIEESPREYDNEVITGVYNCLYDKGITCI